MAEEIQIQSDNHIYYFKTFDDFEAHKDEILNNSQIFIGEMLSSSSSSSNGLQMETIYDMSSDDPNINWGYTSGIQGSSSYRTVPQCPTKYKYIIATGRVMGDDMTITAIISYDKNKFFGGSIESRGANSLIGMELTWNDTQLRTRFMGHNSSTWENANELSNYYLIKIVGVI